MRRERGIALITVVLVVALTSTAAAFVAWRQQVWTRQVENLRDAAQAEAVTRAAIDWAGLILAEDRRDNTVDHIGEDWAKPVTVPVEYGEASGQLSDPQGRFNLNNLVRGGSADPLQVEAFRRLLGFVGLDPGLADAVVDWIDPDDLPTGQNGAEAAYYLGLAGDGGQAVPANRPLADVAELARVRGFDAAALARLAPYVAALPGTTTVNINTAAAEVVAALIPGMSLDDARAALARRGDKGFRDLTEFRNGIGNLHAGNMQNAHFGVATQYFLARIETRFGRVRQHHLALLWRAPNARPAVLWLKTL